jgi:hypothetical protein
MAGVMDDEPLRGASRRREKKEYEHHRSGGGAAESARDEPGDEATTTLFVLHASDCGGAPTFVAPGNPSAQSV